MNDLNKKASTCKASTSFSGSQKLIFGSSGEESSNEEQNVVISGITTSTEHDAAGHNSKGDGERLGISLIFNHNYYINYTFRNSINIYLFFSDNHCPLPTIPSNGPLPWQFNDILVLAIETNKLARHHESHFTLRVVDTC